MKISSNSPYSSSSYIKDRQQENWIDQAMNNPFQPVNFKQSQNLTKRNNIVILALRILHRIKMAVSRSPEGYKNRFTHAVIRVENQKINETRYDNLLKSTTPITLGQGEYLVFHEREDGTIENPSEKTFEKAYQLLLQHSPRVLVKQGSDACENRHQLLSNALKEIDPSLRAVFVPKSLFELVFIRQCLAEDSQDNRNCKLILKNRHNFSDPNTDYDAYQKNRKCWHVCSFKNAGDDQDARIKQVAQRINQVLLDTLKPKSEGFTFQEIHEHAERELSYFKELYRDRTVNNKNVPIWNTHEKEGPLVNFSTHNCALNRSMAIKDDENVQIVRNALSLECSDAAKSELFIFRGSHFNSDDTSRHHQYGNYYTHNSLSFGTSLFAGCLYDGGATAFHYMRMNGNNAYVIPIRYDAIDNSPFYVPNTSTCSQLYGFGETFHARNKFPKGMPANQVSGFNGLVQSSTSEIETSMHTKEIADSFHEYKRRAIQLK